MQPETQSSCRNEFPQGVRCLRPMLHLKYFPGGRGRVSELQYLECGETKINPVGDPLDGVHGGAVYVLQGLMAGETRSLAGVRE